MSPRSVSLAEALKAAALLPDLKAAEAALRAAEAGVRSAGRWPDLSFTFATRSITARESYFLSVPLPWPGRGARIDVAKAQAAIVGADHEVARLTARRALRLAWFNVAAREDMAKAAADRAERVKATADAVGELFDAGRVAQLELSRARAAAAIAAADVNQAEQEHRVAESVLRRLLGILEVSQRIRVERPLPAFEPVPDLEIASAAAFARSPAAKAAEAKVLAAEASVRLASALRFPGLVVEAGVDKNDPTQLGSDRSIGVSLSVPLGAGPALDIARGERDRAVALRDQAKREIADAVEQAWRTAEAARARYQTLEKEALPAAQQAADLAQVAYREGRSDIFRVLDAERALAEARAGLAEAYLAWGVAHAGLLNAIGEDQQ
ncbi:MAG: TolC family protein [Vicinamibacteria bacterium]|nr:TolC family protein [Vicinamibacteria bacterium]